MHKNITVYDIAKEANVSVATVSRVLNKSDKVAESTRQKVQKLIDRYDFNPNEVARSLYRNETKAIGCIVPDISNAYFSKMVLQIEKYALLNGYMLMICSTYSNTENHVKYIQALMERQVAGVIYMEDEHYLTPKLKTLIKKYENRVSIVTINWRMEGIQSYCVESDQTQGFIDVINRLAKSGYRDIALLTGIRGFTSSNLKVKLYKEAVASGIINANEGFIVDCTKNNFTYGADETLQLLSMPKRPNAIIASNDALAVGALKACYMKKLAVPKEIAVVGWDNIPMSEFVYPSITTVAHDYNSLARKAVDIIIDKKQRPSTDCIYTYPMTIINRGSCNLNET